MPQEPAQPATAAETDGTSKEQDIHSAALAFKVELGQADPPARDTRGRFTSEDGNEIEADDEAGEAGDGAADEADAENHDGEDDGDEAADDAQPESADLPTSWNPEMAELWESLDPDAQAYIRQRDAEQTAAVNAKFMEAANLRKANEAEIEAAKADRKRYGEAVDQVLSLVLPKPPPRSMLDSNSRDFAPDEYHYQKALYEDQVAFLANHARQRQALAAQEQEQVFKRINDATRDAFIKSVPEVTDQAKAPAIFQELIDYAVAAGAPPELFDTPTTAIEWHTLWKAKEYDRLQAAKARVRQDPRPAPRKAQPAVRPGVTSPRTAIKQRQRTNALDRLNREGSIEAGAAVFKEFMKEN